MADRPGSDRGEADGVSQVLHELRRSRCAPCERGSAPLAEGEIRTLLAALDGWTVEQGRLARTFRFANYHETMAFVNASAWISHREDHHPDLAVGYNQCTVSYVTHSIGGLSRNDFICAAKLESLFDL
jgi:4a-hydroxytetrahydrobiopterin dehydratase